MMAKQPQGTDDPFWRIAEQLWQRGEPGFVDAVRLVTDADRLGTFAVTWYTDRRPSARQLLFDYLARPLNAYRHEALVKRLFKIAEQAADHEVMARFLVLFDRSVRRARRTRRHTRGASFSAQNAALEMMRRWTAEGLRVEVSDWSYLGKRSYYVKGQSEEEVIGVPRHTTMERPHAQALHQPSPVLSEGHRQLLDKRRLFSLPTRRYLRRRSWRYFRKLGKEHPKEYVAAVAIALKLYQDADVADGLALLDNWGLVHVLFHHSPILSAKRRDWALQENCALSELQPAPIFEERWKASPRTLLDLLRDARCRPVRQWALIMIRRDHLSALHELPHEELLALLASDDPAIVELAAELLRDLAALGIERLLALLETANPQSLPILCDLFSARLAPEHVPLDRVVRVATRRPLPVARLGLGWLRARHFASGAEFQTLLPLVEAEAEPLRAEIVHWLRGVLSTAADFRPEWALEFLDGRYEDVRAEGWLWFQEDPRLRDHVELWQKLLESPHDDVRLRLVAELERRTAGRSTWADRALDEELVRYLWAAVLLNVQRGNRAKPLAVGQLVRRVERHPAEAPVLLPILAVALRSLRGPEWRTGLAGVVRLVDHNADLAPLVQKTFPELRWN
ncbi:MAG: hypothetical protein K2R98_08860 [Gemmataceae bacterium]|nr:hypothetical protein [Gemmataceae bacterium]